MAGIKKDRSLIKAGCHITKEYVWTINNELEMRKLGAAGVDGILTDNPVLLNNILIKQKMRPAK